MKYFIYSVLLVGIFSCSAKYTRSFHDVNNSHRSPLADTDAPMAEVMAEHPAQEFTATVEKNTPAEFNTKSAIFSDEGKKYSSAPSGEVSRLKHGKI